MAIEQVQGTVLMDQRAKLLYNHWSTIYREKGAPYRQDMNPSKFRNILDSVFILDWESTTDVRFRLAGSRICDSFGIELRGMNLFSFWQGEDRARLRQLLHRVVTEPCVGHAVGVQKSECGVSSDFEILLLPLKQRDDQPKQIIGCTILTKENGDTSYCLPISSQWIDGITVYDIPNHESFQPSKIHINSTNVAAEKRVSELYSRPSKPFRGGLHAHPFRVIQGGLAREQG